MQLRIVAISSEICTAVLLHPFYWLFWFFTRGVVRSWNKTFQHVGHCTSTNPGEHLVLYFHFFKCWKIKVDKKCWKLKLITNCWCFLYHLSSMTCSISMRKDERSPVNISIWLYLLLLTNHPTVTVYNHFTLLNYSKQN